MNCRRGGAEMFALSWVKRGTGTLGHHELGMVWTRRGGIGMRRRADQSF